MASRKAKPVKNYDAINITNLDDEFDEFDMNEDITTLKLPGRPLTKTNDKQSLNDNMKLKFNGSENMTQQNGGINFRGSNSRENSSSTVSSTDQRDSKDLSSRTENSDPGNQRTGAKQGEILQSSLQSDSKLNGNSTTHSKQSRTSDWPSSLSSVTSASKLNQSPATTARGTTTTPLNLRNPVSSVKITKRPTVNRNEKGFGHDAQDLFIDDIEDF